jgi:hypothetical protein
MRGLSLGAAPTIAATPSSAASRARTTTACVELTLHSGAPSWILLGVDDADDRHVDDVGRRRRPAAARGPAWPSPSGSARWPRPRPAARSACRRCWPSCRSGKISTLAGDFRSLHGYSLSSSDSRTAVSACISPSTVSSGSRRGTISTARRTLAPAGAGSSRSSRTTASPPAAHPEAAGQLGGERAISASSRRRVDVDRRVGQEEDPVLEDQDVRPGHPLDPVAGADHLSAGRMVSGYSW